MSLPRFFVDASIETGRIFTLPEKQAHHLSRVLRLQANDEIVLFNGIGGEFQCTISSVNKKQVEVQVNDYFEDDRAATLEVHLGMAVLKRDAMDAVLARAVEMGVAQITPVITDNCAVAHKVIQNRQSHWEQVIISACEQCGLNLVPQLNPASNLRGWFEQCRGDIGLIALAGSQSHLPASGSIRAADLLVGPEGGFTGAETALAKEAGFQSVTLGRRVMRAETAPVALLAVLHQMWGDYQPVEG